MMKYCEQEIREWRIMGEEMEIINVAEQIYIWFAIIGKNIYVIC